MRCPSCDFDGLEGARFCAGCGAPLPLLCPACSAPVEGHHKFCAACGHRLGEATPAAPVPSEMVPSTATGERRQVSVLFVDLVGYTKLSGELDAEEVHQLLGRFFERVDGTHESISCFVVAIATNRNRGG